MKVEGPGRYPELKSGITQTNQKTKIDNIPETADKLDKQAGSERISRWFSQIGIFSGYTSKTRLSIEEKITQKYKLSESRKIANLESILTKALDFCVDDGQSEDLDPDWFFNFINMAEQIHSQSMQKLWGKIFAVESNKPGSFSLQTLNLLKSLTQKDANVFRHAVSLASRSKGDSYPRLIVGYYRKKSIWSLFSANTERQLNLAHFGLSYPNLLALMDLGLIHHSEIESGELEANVSNEWRVSGHILNFAPKHNGITWVYFKFTNTGAELSKLVSSHKQDNYVAALKQTLSAAFTIS